MICIVDYGLGNLKAFKNIFDRLGFEARIVNCSHDLRLAQKIILPGVGSFDWAMQCLTQSGMIETLNELVVNKRIPVLGVCVGMQIMALSSEEGDRPGLGWVEASVVKLDTCQVSDQTKLPHMGWNDVEFDRHCPLFQGMNEARFYFLHSYRWQSRNCDGVVAHADYGGKFACAFRSGNIFGTQFHPEKSHDWGVRLLKNFADLC